MLVQDIQCSHTGSLPLHKLAAELSLCIPCRHVEGMELRAPYILKLGITWEMNGQLHALGA